ncbi:hypothetical protein [Methanoregula sp.]|uniref:hypothetical protein n=1 Tax=Methanoregula sp. TaxID=2052170 RepID=UPI003C785172
MARIQKRKYEKIDESEIDLVVQCNDSHEFYERYRELFPTRKKGIDSISKIWKRRSEFVKKQQDLLPVSDSPLGTSQELELLITAQNKVLAELSSVMKEHLKISKEILARLPKSIHTMDEPPNRHGEIKITETKEPIKKTAHEKPSDIMIGS